MMGLKLRRRRLIFNFKVYYTARFAQLIRYFEESYIF